MQNLIALLGLSGLKYSTACEAGGSSEQLPAYELGNCTQWPGCLLSVKACAKSATARWRGRSVSRSIVDQYIQQRRLQACSQD